jgi:hypothetical protein
MDKLTSYVTINDINNLDIDKNYSLIHVARNILTDKFISNSNITIDELFTLLIGTITSITIFLKHYYLFDENANGEIKPEIDQLYYSITVLQNIIIIIYVFYLISMILKHKNYFVSSRYSLITNYIVSIITLSIFLYTNYKK